jgi:tetratricopeptide (TPR) repeat protein
MEQEEGMLFLLRRAKVLSPDATLEQVRHLAARMPAQYAAASELVTSLGGLPLALDQAGAYLEETQCDLPAYLELFRNQRAVLLQQRGAGSRDHPTSVWTTFTLAITATAERHPAVGELLRVCALLQPDAIPEELFRQGGEQLGPTLAAACRETLAWDRVVAVACGYSLLARQPETQTLSMHRLIQAVQLDIMSEAERQQGTQRVLAALDTLFSAGRPEPGPAGRQLQERLLPQALWCLHRADPAQASLPLASVAGKTAQHLCRRGRYGEAEPLARHALRMREQLLGPEHTEVAASLDTLAVVCHEQGQYAEAAPLYQRALRIREQLLGPEHVEVAASLTRLGLLCCDQGQYAQAGQLFARASQTWERTLGPEHYQVATLLYYRGEMALALGQDAQAQTLFERASQTWERTLGAEHPHRAFALCGLAELCQQKSEQAQAQALFQRALGIWEQALGPEHPYVAFSLTGLAALCAQRGQPEEAETLWQRALAIREHRLGPQHPQTARTLHDLALFRQSQGQVSEALCLAERALAIRSRALGETHPKTLATRALYRQLLSQHGQTEPGVSPPQGARATATSLAPAGTSEATSRPSQEPSPALASASDPLRGFLAACCELHPHAWCRSADLWQAYTCWTKEQQERYPLSRGGFIAQLKAHGCRADRTKMARLWRGIALVSLNDDGG